MFVFGAAIATQKSNIYLILMPANRYGICTWNVAPCATSFSWSFM
jgi:hypothetical protein